MLKKVAALTSFSVERNSRIVYRRCFGVDNLTFRPPWWVESWCDKVNGTISLHQEYEEYLMLVRSWYACKALGARHWVCEILSLWERKLRMMWWLLLTRTRTRTGHSCQSVTLGSLPSFVPEELQIILGTKLMELEIVPCTSQSFTWLNTVTNICSS